MKKSIVILVAAFAVGMASCFLYFHHLRADTVSRDELTWLKKEFALNEGQFAEVERLHEAYMPVCDSHCAAYIQARKDLADLLAKNTGVTPETERALETVHRLEMECQRAMLKHGYEIAAVMSPEQGSRYLVMIKDRLVAVDHRQMPLGHRGVP